MTIDEKLLELVAAQREGVLVTIRKSGRPQLTNVLYTWDPEPRTARISTTGPGKGPQPGPRPSRVPVRPRCAFLGVCGRGRRRRALWADHHTR